MEYQCGEWWKISVKPRWINPGLLIPGRCFSTTAFRHGKARFLQNYATKLDAGSNMFRPSCSACWVSITPISSAHGAEKLYQHYVATYVLTSYLASYLTYILTCLLCDILSDIFSEIHSGIPFDIYSDVLFGMLTEFYLMAFYLPVPSDIRHMFRHFIWHSLWHSISHSGILIYGSPESWQAWCICPEQVCMCLAWRARGVGKLCENPSRGRFGESCFYTCVYLIVYTYVSNDASGMCIQMLLTKLKNPWQSRIFGSFCLFASFEFFLGGRFASFELFLPCPDFFSAATYSHVTVASSVVACINADISVPCVFSYNKGWQDLWSLETWPIVVLVCQSSRISANGNLQSLQKSSGWARIKCDVLQFPIEFCGLATIFKVPQGRNPDLLFFAGCCALFACMFWSWMYQFGIKELSMGLEGEEHEQIRSKTPKVQCNCSWAKSRTSTKKLGGGMAPQLAVTKSWHCFRATTPRRGTETP